MGYFSFLSPDQDESPPDLEKPVKVPKGAKVRQPGKDYSLADEEWAREGDDIIPDDGIPKASAEEMDPAGVRRQFSADESSVVQKEQSALRKVQDALQKQTSGLGGDYGNAKVRQVLDAMGKGMLDPGQVSDDVQSLLKDKTLRPETVQTLASAANDLKLAQEQRLKLEAQRAGVPKAQAVDPSVYAGQAEEAFQQAQKLRAEAKNLGVLSQGDRLQRAKNLEAQAASLKQLGESGKADQQGQEQPKEVAPVGTDPVTNFMKGVGVDREALVPRLHAALNKVGIPSDQWGDQNVDPSAGMMRVLSELDPDGKFAQMVVGQLSAAKQEDINSKQEGGKQGPPGQESQGSANSRGVDDLESKIQGKEARMRELYAELRQAPFMRTWPGMILYVLVGMVTQNPAFAARLIGGIGNRDAVTAEMKGLQFDIHRLDSQMKYRMQDEREIKKEAARRMTRREDEGDQRKWELSKMMIQHKLIIDRNARRGNPETFLMKKLASDFQRSLGIASQFKATAQNEFADPKERAAAKQNFDSYMRKAAELDQDIKKLGGKVIQEPAEEAGGE